MNEHRVFYYNAFIFVTYEVRYQAMMCNYICQISHFILAQFFIGNCILTAAASFGIFFTFRTWKLMSAVIYWKATENKIKRVSLCMIV